MALPLIAAGIAARAVAKKLATRAVAGITGAGAKQVAPVYREMGTGSVKVTPANKSNPTNEVQNMFTNNELKRIKSGDSAKAQMRLEEKRNQLSNQFFGKSPTVKINSNTRAR